MPNIDVPYSKNNPFLASITHRYSLCRQGSTKNTQHVVLDLQGSGLKYDIGDCIGVFPVHDADLVQRTLKAMKASGAETVVDKHSGEHWNLKDYLTRKANITEISKKLFGEFVQRQTNPEKKAALENLQNEQNKNALNDYLENHELWDILKENEEVSFELQESVQYADAASPSSLFHRILNEDRRKGGPFDNCSNPL